VQIIVIRPNDGRKSPAPGKESLATKDERRLSAKPAPSPKRPRSISSSVGTSFSKHIIRPSHRSSKSIAKPPPSAPRLLITRASEASDIQRSTTYRETGTAEDGSPTNNRVRVTIRQVVYNDVEVVSMEEEEGDQSSEDAPDDPPLPPPPSPPKQSHSSSFSRIRPSSNKRSQAPKAG